MLTPKKTTVTLIPGDGVGPEITESVCRIIAAANVPIEWEICEAGSKAFKAGLTTGVPNATIDSIIKNGIALKGPLATPIGYGEKSANVTLRKFFETYGNIRPVKSFINPLINQGTPYQQKQIDIVVIRENLEDLYAGIEYAQTPNSFECLKLISRQGCEQIIRLAFEYATLNNRQKIHCVSKANIMKLTEGLFKSVFEEVGKDYPRIETQHILVDNCAHQLVRDPSQFDVLVTTNMNGDILSDLTSALVGGLGFAPSANIGKNCAIFEAVHGSAPKYAGQDTVNPTAFILSAVMMLRHLSYFAAATQIELALRHTIANGIVTRDAAAGKPSVSTKTFTQEIINNLQNINWQETEGENNLTANQPKTVDLSRIKTKFITPQRRAVCGIDIFIESTLAAAQIGPNLEKIAGNLGWKLDFIASGGLKLYPNPIETKPDFRRESCSDLFQCRLIRQNPDFASILMLLQDIDSEYTWVHLEKIQTFDGIAVYSDAHG